jgi:hypothetical protein
MFLPLSAAATGFVHADGRVDLGSIRFSMAILLLVLSAPAVAAPAVTAATVTYRAVLLHPLSDDPFVRYGSSRFFGVSGNQQVGNASVQSAFGGGGAHATLWRGSPDDTVDLHPGQFRSSTAFATDGKSQVGEGVRNDGNAHAVLWHGSAASAVDLHPPGFVRSYAYALHDDVQVGNGLVGTSEYRALLWKGSAASVVDLHPIGFWRSGARGVFENVQVGSGVPRGKTEYESHALVWKGTAESVVDLHPAGRTSSSALAVWGDTQVGSVTGPGTPYLRAYLWRGSAETGVDLMPAGFSTSVAYSVAGDMQVGYGLGSFNNYESRALLWRGTAESVVDLHPFLSTLPIEFVGSNAQDVDINGTIVGIAYDAADRSYAVMWIPVPEPGTAFFAAVAACGWLLGRGPSNRKSSK